jgi:hypothetical protein
VRSSPYTEKSLVSHDGVDRSEAQLILGGKETVRRVELYSENSLYSISSVLGC